MELLPVVTTQSLTSFLRPPSSSVQRTMTTPPSQTSKSTHGGTLRLERTLEILPIGTTHVTSPSSSLTPRAPLIKLDWD